MNWCVKGTKHKGTLERSSVAKTWHVQDTIDISKDEIISLEETSFQLNKQWKIAPCNSFNETIKTLLIHCQMLQPNLLSTTTKRFGVQ
jgi:hypothetical protein